MRLLQLSFLLVITINCFSQPTRIDNDEWLLYNLRINSENHFKPINAEGNQISAWFGEVSGNNQSFDTFICESIVVDIKYNSNDMSFETINVGSTLGGCPNKAVGVDMVSVYDIELKYWSFFTSDGLNTIFNYTITLENLDQARTLTIIAPNGDFAYYHHSKFLNIERLSSLSFSIFPNPAKNNLTVASSNKLIGKRIEIFNVLGNLKMTTKLPASKTISTKNLSKGLYFLVIKDNYGNAFTKKFVKN
ncbi:T9SS type A sorting domain-containing protein [Seonamhaeicola sp. MEBiC1930]|uniref:T9SS type A sorting domain-containing protein n=1 Tax=Seonamhaeicola sp. MEBiC01930 TaxID=2976768 RepID=UPI0032521A96